MGFGSFIHNFASLVTKDKNDMTIVFAFVCVCVCRKRDQCRVIHCDTDLISPFL